MAHEVRIRISGNSYSISPEKTIRAMRGVEPRRIDKYFVSIDGKRFPPKQVICEALGIPPVAFTTQYAYRILQRLGFKVEEEA